MGALAPSSCSYPTRPRPLRCFFFTTDKETRALSHTQRLQNARRDLATLFYLICQTQIGTPTHKYQMKLQRAAFQHALGGDTAHQAVIAHRLFDVIGHTETGTVTCDQFVRGLIPLACPNHLPVEATQLLFQCYDLDDSGSISREEVLVHLYLLLLRSNAGEYLALSPQQLEHLVAATFKTASLNEQGEISHNEFAGLLSRQKEFSPQILSALRLDLNRTIAQLILTFDEQCWLHLEDAPENAETVNGYLQPVSRQSSPEKLIAASQCSGSSSATALGGSDTDGKAQSGEIRTGNGHARSGIHDYNFQGSVLREPKQDVGSASSMFRDRRSRRMVDERMSSSNRESRVSITYAERYSKASDFDISGDRKEAKVPTTIFGRALFRVGRCLDFRWRNEDEVLYLLVP